MVLMIVLSAIFTRRNLMHLISTPLVLLGYNSVSFAALHILAWKGKSVCTHDVSAKTGLPPLGAVPVGR